MKLSKEAWISIANAVFVYVVLVGAYWIFVG